MAARMGSYDIFLNSKDNFLKLDSLDYMEGDSWNLDDDDKFLESIRYGDKLMEEDSGDDFLIHQEDQEQETDSSENNVEFEPSDLLTFTVGEEVMSADSASSAGSSVSESMDDNHDFSVVELVGILPPGVKSFQLVDQDEMERHQDVKVLSVPKNVKILNIPNKKASVQQQPHTTFQELKLSDEERRLLAKEGITMPSHFPLTKSEERELKRIRRKIRNKISAQDSRKRKKEFLDTLQQKIQEVEEEKLLLNKKVRTLELVNARLSAQVKKLQNALAAVAKSACNTQTPPANGNHPNVVPAATTLLVLILSLALVVLPTMEKAAKTNTTGGVENAVLGSFDDSNASLSGKSRTMMGISSGSKTGLATSYEVTEDWEDLDLDSLPPMAKIPRFSFHQGRIPGEGPQLQRQSLATPTGRFMGTSGGGVVGRKRNSFQMNSVLDQLD